MGYDLPAAIGAVIGSGGTVLCLTGEGSIQMNIQELQTIVHNNLPIKIVIFNNNSYQAIVNTQTNFFNGVLTGCSNDSGLSFPSFEKLAYAYGFPFKSIKCAVDIESAVEWLFDIPGYAILELVQTKPDPIEPKLSGRKLDDGSMLSPPIDDMFPFLTKDEYAQCGFSGFYGGGL
jgi:acetolactate synthase-1/2/3 large subunit